MVHWKALNVITLGLNQTDNISLNNNNGTVYSYKILIGLNQGFSNFFVLRPFPNIFKISATLKCYKL